ncbi:MAG: spore coat U domain-containing protein [Geobacteraceae bacterium]|nr:spore coat U domain-containing protein [Geobacteraceae bacterium]
MKSLVRVTLFLCTLLICAESFAFTCRIATTPVNFGTYDVFSRFVLDSTGTVSVTCNNIEKKPMSIRVTLSAGNSGVFNPRELRSTSGPDRLSYYLFSDPSMTVVWGDGTGGSSYVSAVVTRDSTLTSLIYGRIPPGQNVSVGSYSDVLTATVLW